MRECGLKYECYHCIHLSHSSLPVRECGLKSHHTLRQEILAYVTPRAGVWIEIQWVAQCLPAPGVTPRAGVWIEICLI